MECEPSPSPYNTDIKSRLKYLLDTGRFADIYFKVGAKIFPAHKSIICTGCEVFDTMFHGSIPETRDQVPVLDTNVEADAFYELLK